MTTEALPRLRPLSLAELLDQAIRLYRRNFLRFVGIIAVVQIPITLLSLLTSLFTFGNTFAQFDPTDPAAADPFAVFTLEYFARMIAGFALTIILGLVSFVLTYGVAAAALAQAVADDYLGKPTGFLDTYRRIGRSWLPLLGAILIGVGVLVVLFVWLMVPCIGSLTGLAPILFFMWAILPLIAPIVVYEQRGGFHPLRRAWDLVRRRFWWVTGFVIVLLIFSQLVTSGPAVLVSVVFSSLQAMLIESLGPSWTYTLQVTIQSLLGLVASLVYLPLHLTGMMLVYFDLRVRTEGFDLAWQAESALDSGVDAAEMLARVPPLEKKSLLTWTEVGYFAALSVGLAVAGCALYVMFFSVLTALAAAIGGSLGVGP